ESRHNEHSSQPSNFSAVATQFRISNRCDVRRWWHPRDKIGARFHEERALGELSRSSWNSGGRLIYSSAVSAASRRSLASACALGFEAASIVTASNAEEIVFRACSCTCCRTLSSDSSTRDRRANTACLPITCRTRLGRFDGQAGEGQWLAAAPRHLYN